jgi:hypothetical protein
MFVRGSRSSILTIESLPLLLTTFLFVRGESFYGVSAPVGNGRRRGAHLAEKVRQF